MNVFRCNGLWPRAREGPLGARLKGGGLLQGASYGLAPPTERVPVFAVIHRNYIYCDFGACVRDAKAPLREFVCVACVLFFVKTRGLWL